MYLCSKSQYRSKRESTIPMLQILLLVQEQDGMEYTVSVLWVLLQEQDGIHCTCALGPGKGVGWNPLYLCSRSCIGVGWNPLYLCSRSWYRSRMESTVPVLQVLVKDRDEIHCTSALGSGIKVGWECTCALGPGIGVGWKRNEMDNTRLGTHQQSIQPSAISNQYKY